MLLGGAYLSLPPLFEEISRTEGWSLQTLQQAWALIPLGSGLVALATGAILVRHEDRPVALVAGVLAIAGLFVQSVSPNPAAFLAASFVFGAGAGALLVALTSRVARSFVDDHAGVAQAAFFGAYTVGTAVGLATAELLSTELGGWRRVPLVWGTLAVISLVPMLRHSMPAPRIDGVSAGGRTPLRPLALYGLVYAFYIGAYLGIAGLLPYQLREWGWDGETADGILALSTLGFLVGAFGLAVLTDRIGYRRTTFIGCMVVAALLTAFVPGIARDQSAFLAASTITTLGVACGALSLFFPIVLDDPATGGTRAASSVGTTTAASYFGGFLIPFAFAPWAEERPVVVLVGYASAFALAGGSMALAAALADRRVTQSKGHQSAD